ncbi:YrhB domain-containing protein [Duganella callida]|nr:YrhB domain-containing protein [Duganella callida]
MDTISRDAAVQIATAKVHELADAAGDDFALTHEVREIEQGWVFFFNSADFVRTGDYLTALAGNGPLMVLRNGTVIMLPSVEPWEEVIAKMPSRQQAQARQNHSA